MKTVLASGSARQVLKELDFDVDGFGNQKYLTDAESAAKQILIMLFLRKGDYPSMPDLGIDISRYVRFKNMDMVTGGALKERITTQMNQYCPGVQLKDVVVYATKYKGQPVLIIDFEVEAEKTISIALTQATKKKTINFKVDFTSW